MREVRDGFNPSRTRHSLAQGARIDAEPGARTRHGTRDHASGGACVRVRASSEGACVRPVVLPLRAPDAGVCVRLAVGPRRPAAHGGCASPAGRPGYVDRPVPAFKAGPAGNRACLHGLNWSFPGRDHGYVSSGRDKLLLTVTGAAGDGPRTAGPRSPRRRRPGETSRYYLSLGSERTAHATSPALTPRLAAIGASTETSTHMRPTRGPTRTTTRSAPVGAWSLTATTTPG